MHDWVVALFIRVLSLPRASVHWLVQCTLDCHWNTTGWPSVHWYTTGWPGEYLQGTQEHNWKNLIETAPHWYATGKTLTIAAYTRTPLAGLEYPTHTHAPMIKQRSIFDSLKWQDGGTPNSKWTGLCKFSFHFQLTALQCIPVLLFKRVSTSTSLSAWF